MPFQYDVSEIIIEGIYLYAVANIIIYFLNKTERGFKTPHEHQRNKT